MAKASFLPKDDDGKAHVLEHFAATLPRYAELLDLSAAKVQSTQDDARQQTARKNLLRDGGATEVASPQPPAVRAKDAPTVAPGIFTRVSSLVQGR